ncbi:MAG: hypothetical protein COS14_12465 [Bacteroidetes bacterium CG02_land_8_20_14_3_00_31_25]|nr:MAG: hypothetical protein COS14_12465 [Bacteroidetes bacterium CG02_land_8_20_14_3_00_31_25]PIX36046.1 MAG: hypothetical protein COZ59_03190 [Bacteroidetes bacterium CG_4_8_14_3_um_filter_31_14]PIY06000.1 MAG: hypothetical protein COZ21_03520 [Bacteroidetes bacterium CG_4_10_14_3_um_filter_31_20]
MNKSIFLLFVLLLSSLFAICNSYKVDYYNTLSSNDTILINNQLKIVANSKFVEKKAFMGALLMKKAGLMSSLKEKLSFFKKGKQLLEDAILNEKQNAEYRFLRIMIQENCPSILMYYKNIEEDKELLKNQFKKLEIEVKNAIIDYCKISEVIKINEFE